MASKEHGRDPKTKLGLAKARGEASVKVQRNMNTGNPANENLAGIYDKSPDERWLFTEDQLQNTPSRRENKAPITAEKELNYRQQAANLIQDMGQRLPVNQLTINTAIVYMHRFYIFHPFQTFSRFHIAPTALFLAAKVEEQPRKLEHVIRVCHSCLSPDKPQLDVHSDDYSKQVQRLVQHELIMLQTLGFDISIDHPHTHVVKCTQLVKASRDLSQMAYFLATNSLHLTTFCLKYKPTVVSAMCIHLSCKWSNYEIPLSSTGKAYWTYMDPTITESLLENIIKEFLKILNLCPTRLRKLKNYKPSARDGGGGGSTPQSKDGHQGKPSTSKSSHPVSQPTQHTAEQRQRVSAPPSQSDLLKKPTASLSLAEYKDKREKELQSKQSVVAPAEISKIHKNITPNVSASQRSHQQHSHPNHKLGQTRRPPGHSDTRHHYSTSHSGLTKLLTESDSAKPLEKIHPRSVNHQHKRPEKPPQQQIPSGIPGLQKPKNPTTQFTSHGASQHSHKEHQKMQGAQRKQHNKPSPPQRQKELSISQPAELQSRGHEPIPGGALDDNVLEGMEQKLIENIKAEKSFENTTPSRPKPQPTNSNHHNASLKEHNKSRHSLPGLPGQTKEASSSQPQPSHTQSKAYLYEQYKKNPESLRQQLKLKVQTEPLSEYEKILLNKMKKKKEEDRQKKKRRHEKHKLNRSQPIESLNTSEGGNVTPGGGPLTVRIKLPASVRAKISQPPVSGLASSSGSGSEAVMSSPGSVVPGKSGRKRTHGHDNSNISDISSAKHSRKSDSHHHHHHQSNHSSHDSSRSRHRHSRSGSHHHSKSQSSSSVQIDDSTFQQALVNAVSMVQSGGHGAPGTSSSEKVVPTVTLKRTGTQNGSGENYVAQSVKHKSSKRSKHVFDPSTPISATPPDDIFEGEPGEYPKHSIPGDNNDADSHPGSKNAEISSPETGEILNDDDDDDDCESPFRENVTDQSNYYQSNEIYPQRRSNTNNNNNNHPQSMLRQRPSDHNMLTGSHGPGTLDGYNKSHNNRLPPLAPPLTAKQNRSDQR